MVLTIGRRVWVRMGRESINTQVVLPEWRPGVVVASTGNGVTVRVGVDDVHIHRSVYRRDLRVSAPSEEGGRS